MITLSLDNTWGTAWLLRLYLRRINTDFARESRYVDFVVVNIYNFTIIILFSTIIIIVGIAAFLLLKIVITSTSSS